jgi:hypothetical protein
MRDDIIKCVYIIPVVTGATDGIGKEYARQVSDNSSSNVRSSSNATNVSFVPNDDLGTVDSAHNPLVD